jgi:hypothetical protein
MPQTTRELIEAAFADVPYPGDDRIADHQDCEECDDVRAFFRGKSWRELKFPELYGNHSALSFFTPQALQYFLPGFMLASLGHWEEADLTPAWILFGWLPEKADATESMRQYRIARQSIFSLAQRAAIAAYLREYEAYDDPCRGEGDIPIAIGKLLNEGTSD